MYSSYPNYNNNNFNNNSYSNIPNNYNYSNMEQSGNDNERIGFIAPFLLGGLAGAALSPRPYYYNNYYYPRPYPYYPNYYPYYR